MTRKPFTAIALATVLLAACSKSSTSATPAASTVSISESASASIAATDVTTYMTGLCTSVGDWKTSIQAGNKTFQDTLSSGTPTPEDVKSALSAYLTAAVQDTQTLVTQIQAMGPPDVDGGSDVHAQVVAALNSVSTLFQNALTSVQGLDTTNPAQMATALQGLATTLQQGSKDISDAFGSIQTGEFATAAQNIPACQSL